MINSVNVVASKITPRKIYYECPYCFKTPNGSVYDTNRTKSGKVIKSRRPNIHHHGNEYNKIDGNWTTERTSHCLINDAHVIIKINEETKREVL